MVSTLRISRQQLAAFLKNDHDAIRQFETLFNAVANPDTTATATEPEIVVETAAHEALARIERLERALGLLEFAPSLDSKENYLGNPPADDYALTSKVDGTRAWVKTSGVVLQSKIATGDNVSVVNGTPTTPTTVALTTRVASLTITPTKIGNKIRVRGCYVGEKSSTGNTCMALFVGSTHIRQTVTSAQGGYAHSGSTIGEYVTTSLDILTVDLRCNGNNETATIHWATLEVEEILN